MAHVVQKFVDDTPLHSHWLPGLALIYADLGQLDKAKTIFDDLLSNDLCTLAKDAMWLTCIAYLCEICHRLKEPEAAKILYQALLPYQGFNILVGSNICTLGATDRYLGLLAITMQEFELAEKYLLNAVEQNQQQGFYVYAAHSRYELANMISQRRLNGDRQQAQSLVDEVLVFSQKTQMQALTKKALTLRNKVRSGPEIKAVDEFGLSKREQEVLRLIAQGKHNKDIAEQLFISNNTVAAHIRNILEKTGTTNRIEASNLAQQKKLLK
jgi:DNA-binding CsgD family transcriptional regulator